MEKIIFKHLYNFALDNEILYKYQSGFQTNDFTVNQLVEIYNTIILNMDKGIKDIRFVFCDITKAFDRVWHNGLLFKLKHYGVAGNILSWIEHYLTDRKQKVVVKGFSSSFKSINAGVPQGSVLGPFLFLLYINDISNGLANSIRLFADDTTLYATVECDINNVSSSLNDDLEKLLCGLTNGLLILIHSKQSMLTSQEKNYNYQNCNSVLRDQKFPNLYLTPI